MRSNCYWGLKAQRAFGEVSSGVISANKWSVILAATRSSLKYEIETDDSDVFGDVQAPWMIDGF